MQRIDLSNAVTPEVIEITLPSGKVRVQVNATVGGMRSDVVQMDASAAADQTISSGSNYFKVTRRLKAARQQEAPCQTKRRLQLWPRLKRS